MTEQGLCSSLWCCFNSAKLERLWDVNLFFKAGQIIEFKTSNFEFEFVSRFSAVVGWPEQQGHPTSLLSGGRLEGILCYCIQQVPRLLNKLIFHYFSPLQDFLKMIETIFGSGESDFCLF